MLHSFIQWDSMQGMVRLYARNVIFFETYCCTRPIILENFALTTNFKVYAETCLLVVCSSLGCLSCIFSYGLKSLSERVLKTMRTSANNRHLFGWCTTKFRITECSILLNLLLLLLNDVGVHCNKTSTDKAIQNFLDNVFVWSSCFVFLGFTPVSVTWESQVWKSSDLKFSSLTL